MSAMNAAVHLLQSLAVGGGGLADVGRHAVVPELRLDLPGVRRQRAGGVKLISTIGRMPAATIASYT